MPEEQAQRDEDLRRRNHPSAAKKVDDWLEFVGDRIEKGEVRFPFPLFESCHPDIAFLADSAKFPWGTLQDMFLDKDRDEFFRVLKGRLELQPNDINLRAAAISLYWHLSRLYLKWQYPDYDIDDVTGEWVEDRVNEATGELVPLSYWETDLSGEREHHRREFHGYLSRLVRLVNVEDCSDWQRTNWEIRNACAARDWDRAKELFRHASVRKQHTEPELTVLEWCFDYRVEFGPQIDSRLGLGLRPPGDVHPYWESVRTHFLAHHPLSLDALEVPLDYFYPQSKLSKLFCHETSLCFVWGALQDDPSPRSSNARNASRHEGVMTGHEFEEFGPYQDFCMSIVAQQREACGDLGGAAWVYETLASRPEPFENVRSSILFTLRSAKLYRALGETAKARNVLEECKRRESPDILAELQEVYLAQGDVDHAQDVAKRLSAMTTGENLSPKTRLLLNLPQPTVSPELLQKEIRECPCFLSLCSSCKDPWKLALSQELESKAAQSLRDERARDAAFKFCTVVERELREKVFDPFRKLFPGSDIKQRSADQLVARDERFRSYLAGRDLNFGDMVRCIRTSIQMPDSLFTRYLGDEFPALGQRETVGWMEELTRIRNDVHRGLDPQLAPRAHPLAERTLDAINWRWRAAVHESGHAVAALFLPDLKLVSVALRRGISPRGFPTSGSCDIHFRKDKGGNASLDTYRQRITDAYCGSQSEALFFREDPCDVLKRHEDDRSFIEDRVVELQRKGLGEPEILESKTQAWQSAKSLVEERRSTIEAVALSLAEKGKLTGHEAEEIARRIHSRLPQSA
jgi:hypothetical protein